MFQRISYIEQCCIFVAFKSPLFVLFFIFLKHKISLFKLLFFYFVVVVITNELQSDFRFSSCVLFFQCGLFLIISYYPFNKDACCFRCITWSQMKYIYYIYWKSDMRYYNCCLSCSFFSVRFLSFFGQLLIIRPVY